MDIERDQILQVYSVECEERLATMEESLLELEANPSAEEALNTVFRMCHTLKGDSAIVGFSEIAEFAHVLEDLLECLRSGTASVSGTSITLLLEGVDALRQLVPEALREGSCDLEPHGSLLDQLRGAIGGQQAEPGPSGSSHPGVPEHELRQQPDLPRLSVRKNTLRVRVETLDHLLNLTGELAIGRSRLTQLLSTCSENIPADVLETHSAMDPLFAALQGEVMAARMVPIGPVFRHHLRTVRDLAREHQKQAGLQVEGEQAELETTVIDQLRDCLGHLIRNAIVHGIEIPEERVAKGKHRFGRIVLRARHEGPTIIIEVADDGAGLDRERIRSSARALGIVGESEELTEARLAEVIFAPGLSTTSETTMSSGRGVGMDVVRQSIEALGGDVAIESQAGEGTIVRIRLPLTVAIVEGFAVGVGGETYVIPLSAVVECVDLPREAKRNGGRSQLLNLRGQSLPYVRLRELLGLSGEPACRESIVVIRHNGEEVGVVVDTLHGESQALIKPLGKAFRDQPGIAGATILGNGRVSLILDVSALLRKTVGWQHQTTGDPRPSVVRPSGGAPSNAC